MCLPKTNLRGIAKSQSSCTHFLPANFCTTPFPQHLPRSSTSPGVRKKRKSSGLVFHLLFLLYFHFVRLYFGEEPSQRHQWDFSSINKFAISTCIVFVSCIILFYAFHFKIRVEFNFESVTSYFFINFVSIFLSKADREVRKFGTTT